MRLAELSDVRSSEEAALFIGRWVEDRKHPEDKYKILVAGFASWEMGGIPGKTATMQYGDLSNRAILLPLAYSPDLTKTAPTGDGMPRTGEERKALPPLGTLKPSDVVPGMILGHRCEGCRDAAEETDHVCRPTSNDFRNFNPCAVSEMHGERAIFKHPTLMGDWWCPLSQCYPVDTGNGTWFPEAERVPVKIEFAKGVYPVGGSVGPGPAVVVGGAQERNEEVVPLVHLDWKCPHCGRVCVQEYTKTVVEQDEKSHWMGKWEGCWDCFSSALGFSRKTPPDVAARRERREWLESLTARPEPRKVEK